jgi:hypothetical protein
MTAMHKTQRTFVGTPRLIPLGSASEPPAKIVIDQRARLDVPRQITRKNHSERVFQRRRSSARLWEQLREYFEVRFRAEKYGVPYFLAESEAKQSDPRKEAVGARAPKAFGGRGFKWRAPSGVCRMGVGRLSHRWRLDPIVSQTPEIQCNAL